MKCIPICFFSALLFGCGGHFASAGDSGDRFGSAVNTKDDVFALPVSTTWIRARFLPDKDFSSLSHLPALEDLDFSGYKAGFANFTDGGLAHLDELALPKLKTLFFDHCPQVTDDSLSYIKPLKNITFLAFVACPNITDGGLAKLVAMPHLVELDLRGCTGITDEGVKLLAHKSQWQRIEFGGCPNVTVEAVAALQQRFPGAHIKKDEQEWSQEVSGE